MLWEIVGTNWINWSHLLLMCFSMHILSGFIFSVGGLVFVFWLFRFEKVMAQKLDYKRQAAVSWSTWLQAS